jgi:peptidoglycan/LPS O-acetylase OafA/YrhL
MSKSLSLYLDGVRFLAAVLVFLFHMGYFAGWYVPVIGRSGSEAVIVFFVLSGFLISFSAQHKHADFEDYALARFARLWSVVLPAIGLTFLLDTVGQALAPAAYAPLMPYSPLKWLIAGLANASFLNQFWLFSIWPGSNGPFWSIAYEFWYYAIFGACFYLTGWRRFALTTLTLLVAGPKIIFGFPIWLIGAALCLALARSTRPNAARLGRVVWWGSLALIAGFFAFDLPTRLAAAFPAFAQFGRDTWEVDFLPESYLLGLILGLNLGGFILMAGSLGRTPRPFVMPIRIAADASFGLYLFHYPIGYFVKAVLWNQGITGGTGYVATIYLVSFAASFGLGLLFDPLRKPLRRWLDRLCARFRSAADGIPTAGATAARPQAARD